MAESSGVLLLRLSFWVFVNYVVSVQVQPLSLEELLAKKKAEEEAEAKVRIPDINIFLFKPNIKFFFFPHSLSSFVLFSPSSCPKRSEKRRL